MSELRRSGQAARLANLHGTQTDILADTAHVLVLRLVGALVVALDGQAAVINTELLLIVVEIALCSCCGDDA